MLRDAMDKAADQALRAGQIIRRLRDFVARGESERRVEDVKKLIEEASALALVGAKDKGVRVRFDFDPRSDFVLADKVQIQQVLLNLMRNAIEAMEDTEQRELVIATSPATGHYGRDQRRRYRIRNLARDQRAAVPAVRHDQDAMAWASGCRSREPSSRRMAARSRRGPIPAAARYFPSRCPP